MKNKIAFISEHASPLATLGGVDSGGQNVYVAELALQMGLLGYEVDIFTRWENPKLSKIVYFSQGIRIVHVKAGPLAVLPKEEILIFMEEFKSEMLNFIEAQQLTYKVIHANFFMSGLVAMQLKEQLRIPFVITFHALGKIRQIFQKEQDHFSPQRIEIEKLIVREADRVIAECPQDFDDLIRYYHADARNIVIIPCGFNPKEFYPIEKCLSKKRINIDSNEAVILQLGRMVPRKGIDNVIRALPLIKVRNKVVKLVIVGGESGEHSSSKEFDRLKMLVDDLEINDRVVFAGRRNRDELKYFYSAADIFVTTPWYEPFGITPLESMACGTPVIGSSVGGIKHTVVDGETGFLVTSNDPQELADKLTCLLENQDLLNHMSLRALTHVHEHYTWHKVAEQMDKVYQSVMMKEEVSYEAEASMIAQAFEEAATTFKKSAVFLAPQIAEAATVMSNALKEGRKILVCGNGGSAAESQHFAAELVGRFEIPKRRGLPVISLTADCAILTAWANDFGYDEVFARQVAAYGTPGDILLCLSTSGTSANIISAMVIAKEMGMTCINMLGKDGGEAVNFGNVNLIVPSDSTPRIQEVHLHLVHLLCYLIENKLFASEHKEVKSEVYPFKVLNNHVALNYNQSDTKPHYYGS